MNTKKSIIYITNCWLIGFVFSACTENFDSIVPSGGNDAYINFYNAMEVALQSTAADSLAFDNYIYVNDSVPGAQFKNFPQFSQSFTDDGRQYPSQFTGVPLVTDIAGGSGGVYWMPVIADTYKFIFTSRNKVFLKDTTITLTPKTYTVQYITESPVSDSAYTIVTAPVELKGTKGKTRVQVVNLATDWGPIDVYQVDTDDNEMATGLPQNLSFGKHGDYAELDVKSANNYNKLVLKFRKHGETGARVTVSLPALSGSSYTLVVQGFTGEAKRYIKKNNTGYLAIDIAPNPRVNIRRVF